MFMRLFPFRGSSAHPPLDFQARDARVDSGYLRQRSTQEVKEKTCYLTLP